MRAYVLAPRSIEGPSSLYPICRKIICFAASTYGSMDRHDRCLERKRRERLDGCVPVTNGECSMELRKMEIVKDEIDTIGN